jgi:hypothetical protein
MKRRDKVTEYLKYDFSLQENGENAQALARKNRALAEFGLKKKALSSDLKKEEDDINGEIAKLARFVTDAYDFRMIDCRVMFDSPEDGMKTIVRIDTGEVVRSERMSDDEKQRDLPFADSVQRPDTFEECPTCGTRVAIFDGAFGDHGIVRGATGARELCAGSKQPVAVPAEPVAV